MGIQNCYKKGPHRKCKENIEHLVFQIVAQ